MSILVGLVAFVVLALTGWVVLGIVIDWLDEPKATPS